MFPVTLPYVCFERGADVKVTASRYYQHTKHNNLATNRTRGEESLDNSLYTYPDDLSHLLTLLHSFPHKQR